MVVINVEHLAVPSGWIVAFIPNGEDEEIGDAVVADSVGLQGDDAFVGRFVETDATVRHVGVQACVQAKNAESKLLIQTLVCRFGRISKFESTCGS